MLTDTRGFGVMTNVFKDYEPYKGDIQERSRGSVVAFEDGVTTAYGLFNAQERATLFVGPGVQVYGGMIVGENSREDDLVVNVKEAIDQQPRRRQRRRAQIGDAAHDVA